MRLKQRFNGCSHVTSSCEPLVARHEENYEGSGLKPTSKQSLSASCNVVSWLFCTVINSQTWNMISCYKYYKFKIPSIFNYRSYGLFHKNAYINHCDISRFQVLAVWISPLVVCKHIFTFLTWNGLVYGCD